MAVGQAAQADDTITKPGSAMALAASAYVFAVIMMGTTIPTSLYPAYAAKFGFGSTATTVLFAIYAAGVIGALIGFGRFSESVGRKPMLAAGIVLSLGSAVVFIIGSNMALLYTGRILSGLSAGILTATGTVVVMENAPAGRGRLAAAVATSANIGGLGLGILVAGLVARFVPGPLLTPFIVHAGLLVVAGLALLPVRERVRAGSSGLRLQLPGIPHESRRTFLAAAPGAITGYTVCGLFSSIGPNFMSSRLGIHSPAVIGTVVFLLFGASAAAQLALRKLADRTLILIGSVAMLASMATLVTAVLTGSLVALIASSILAGVGQGLLFMTGMRALTGATRASRRTEATTSYFVVAYLAMSVPAIGAGLVAIPLGLTGSAVVFAVAVAAVAALGLLGLRQFKAEPAAA